MKFQILSYEIMKGLSSKEKIDKILDFSKKGDIILLEGRLSVKEETELYARTMEIVDKNFKGIDVAYLDSFKDKNLFDKLKNSIVKFLLKDRLGITVIGPSKVVKDIKMDPKKIEILVKK